MKPFAGPVARIAGILSRISGRGGGTTLPGVIAMRLRDDALSHFGAKLTDGSVAVSATNGKTTTTKLIVQGAKELGFNVTTNAAGSNLARGVVSSLVHQRREDTLGVFEVDEAALAQIVDELAPRVIVLMNLFRDQLDRYGELDAIVDRWSDVLATQLGPNEMPVIVANADDPNVVEIASIHSDVLWFGIEDTSANTPEMAMVDATSCRRCDAALERTATFVGHLGHWRCSSCDAERPKPHIAVTKVITSLSGMDIEIRVGNEVMSMQSKLAGLHNAYNIAAAVAALVAVFGGTKNLDLERLAEVLSNSTAAFGRGEVVEVEDASLSMLLAKNPTGANQNLLMVLNDNRPLHLFILLNDRTADGRDVSWIWDVDWEMLKSRNLTVTLSGDRCYELALRFKYGGFELENFEIETDYKRALDKALAKLKADPSTESLYALPTYTAMLDLRQELAERGYLERYWEAK